MRNRFGVCWLMVCGMITAAGNLASAQPRVFWAEDSNAPGNVVLLYGGGLADVRSVGLSRTIDSASSLPDDSVPVRAYADLGSAKAIQASENSLKFVLPANAAPGVFQVTVGDGQAQASLLNRPLIWFMQPTTLEPGLTKNEATAGAEVQVIGRDFLLPHDVGTTKIAIKPKSGGKWQLLKTTQSDRFSLVARLPESVADGNYDLSVSNGFGGAQGWSDPLEITVKRADTWPSDVFEVKKFGAVGDGVHDDTAALRAALAAADKNGGGIVHFPWGTFRLSNYIAIGQRTILRGDDRDATILQWPADEPKSIADFSPAAVYASGRYGIENLTLIVRKVDETVVNLNSGTGGVPDELKARMQPWGAMQDVFLRHVNFEHWLMASHPDKNAALWATKYTGDGAVNFKISSVRNFEVSDCVFQGGHQMFMGLENARVTDNSFSNEMGYCWTVLGGGAHYEVCTGNDIRASSSWGYGPSSLAYVYSAHNVSHNFVRGEREAMTLDISALPTGRPVSQYWGSPVDVGNTAGDVFLKFPPAGQTSADGFKSGFVPGCFRGGTVTVHGYTGGPGANQTRTVVDNTADTVTLDKPWNTPPDTTPRKLYVEVAPRTGGSCAWFGLPTQITSASVAASGAKWVPEEFVGMDVMVLDGAGTGQFRTITGNTTNTLTIDRAWDVAPDTKSTLGIWAVMQHMTVYDCQGFDTSAFAQLWGSFYDYVVDSCTIDRSQGTWGQSGWFVQFRYNLVRYGMAFHPGIGPHGDNPEGNLPFGFVGLIDGNLRITKFGELQYGVPSGKAIMVNDVVPNPVPGVRGTIVKGNELSFNQRISFPPFDTLPPRTAHFNMCDVIVDSNKIEHSAVGVQIGSNVGGAVVWGNQYTDVNQPTEFAAPGNVVSTGLKADMRQP